MKAQDFLKAGLAHMQERAVTHDKPAGERSIPATVAAFKAITGDGLMNTEERGWLFMQLLKAVRSQQGEFNKDNYEDGASYCGLAGESAYVERCLKPASVIMPDAVTGNWPASADERIDIIGQNGGEPHYAYLEIIQDNIVTKAPGDVFIQTEDGETARYSAAGYAASKEQ